MKYPTLKELSRDLKGNGDDYCVEFPDSTWSTITRVHVSPEFIARGVLINERK